MIKRMFVFAFFLFLCNVALAVAVEWNCFDLITIGRYPTIGYTGCGVCAQTSLSLTLSRNGNGLLIGESGQTVLVSFSSWSLAQAGETISSSLFNDREGLLFDAKSMTGTPILVDYYDDAFLLAVQALVWDDEFGVGIGRTVYAWVALTVNEGILSLDGSALALDGGSLLAGGDAIPEPSTAWLLMFGCAGLALRRRRGCPK